MIELDAYFTRIGYAGPRVANLSVLRAVHALHPVAIPFENLDPLLHLPVPLDLVALQDKMVHRRRGGYCFEQNTLFHAVLQQLGFTVTVLAARVLWMRPPGAPPNPRTHMVLKIDLENGPYIADVGFGGQLATAPLKLLPNVEQETQAAMLCVHRTDMGFTLQTKLGGVWRDVYRFTEEPQLPIDLEVGNWFTSTFPTSRFRNNLIIQRLTPDGRVSLLNTRLVRHRKDGQRKETMLVDAAALGRALTEDFLLDPPADAATIFARLPSG